MPTSEDARKHLRKGDSLAGGTRRTTSRLLDGANYPPVRSLFPASHNAEARITVAALVEVVRRVALVAGEPGVGKSRLVREFATMAAADGALVLYGGCDAAVRAPYRPFVEALDQLLRAGDPATLRAAIGWSYDLLEEPDRRLF